MQSFKNNAVERVARAGNTFGGLRVPGVPAAVAVIALGLGLLTAKWRDDSLGGSHGLSSLSLTNPDGAQLVEVNPAGVDAVSTKQSELSPMLTEANRPEVQPNADLIPLPGRQAFIEVADVRNLTMLTVPAIPRDLAQVETPRTLMANQVAQWLMDTADTLKDDSSDPLFSSVEELALSLRWTPLVQGLNESRLDSIILDRNDLESIHRSLAEFPAAGKRVAAAETAPEKAAAWQARANIIESLPQWLKDTGSLRSQWLEYKRLAGSVH